MTGPAAALAPGAPPLHPELSPGNVCAEVHRLSGDPQAAPRMAARLQAEREEVLDRIEMVRSWDVDEVACLIDFGFDHTSIMKSLDNLLTALA